jgi:hypothetical protein
MAARWNSSRAPERPRSRMRSNQVGKAHLDAFALVTRLEKKPSSALAGAPNLVRPHEDRAGLVAQACWDSIVS